MTYYADTCKRCNATFFWHRQPAAGESRTCNTCDNELANIQSEVVMCADMLAFWDDIGGEG